MNHAHPDGLDPLLSTPPDHAAPEWPFARSRVISPALRVVQFICCSTIYMKEYINEVESCHIPAGLLMACAAFLIACAGAVFVGVGRCIGPRTQSETRATQQGRRQWPGEIGYSAPRRRREPIHRRPNR
jgi:hypothetical protein